MVSIDLKGKLDWKKGRKKHFHLIIWKNNKRLEAPLFSEALSPLWLKNKFSLLTLKNWKRFFFGGASNSLAQKQFQSVN